MTISVRDLGARGDDATDDTAALQSALDRASGSGEVLLAPPGRYRTGTLFVRSHTVLELAASAVLVGPRGPDEWARFTPVEYRDPLHAWDNGVKRHLLVIQDAEQVVIRGQGVIDGQGWGWCRAGDDPAGWHIGFDPRPDVMVAAIRCRDLRLEGITLTDPPNWNLDLYCCDRVQVRGVTIASDPRLPNNDGIDISGSQDVVISDCRIDVGDDGIVINGRGRPVRRVAVTNCLISSECAALKVGWEYTRHGISQIAFSNCVLTGCNRGLACYSCNGAAIEDVVASNLVMDSNAPIMFARPVHLDLRRGRDTGTVGAIRRIQVSNLVARTQGRILMTAETGGLIEDVTLRDLHLAYPYLEDPEPIAEENRSAQFSNPCRAARRARAALVAENLRGLAVEGLRLTWPGDTVPDEWKRPARRENGGRRIFRPDYAPRPCAFSAAWLRNVQGWWRAPAAQASAAGTPRFDQDALSRLALDEPAPRRRRGRDPAAG
mgnify:CR=1 FL=1